MEIDSHFAELGAFSRGMTTTLAFRVRYFNAKAPRRQKAALLCRSDTLMFPWKTVPICWAFLGVD
jgi:hypothetical protein